MLEQQNFKITEEAYNRILEGFARNLIYQLGGEGQEIDNETLLMTIKEMLTNDEYYQFLKEEYKKHKVD